MPNTLVSLASMTNHDEPLFVVVAYNRPQALNRLLQNLAQIPEQKDMKLLISIDNSGPESLDVKRVADEFSFSGKKSVILHPERLGLRNHILKCGDLSAEHGSVVILEDDLLVSPSIYSAAKQMLGFYASDDAIAGISLYSYTYSETADVSWSRIKGKGDVHAMSLVSSSGQGWTKNQWQSFRTWLDSSDSHDWDDQVPFNVRNWPDSSWKKHFMNYVVSQKKYIVYPNEGLSSNSGDSGTHLSAKYNRFRSYLSLNDNPLQLEALEDISFKYDAHHELEAGIFKKWNSALAQYDFDVDVLASKHSNSLNKDLVLTTRSCSETILSWGIELEPIELNVLLNIPGSEIKLTNRAHVMHVDADRLNIHKWTDRTPLWIHDALGRPLKSRLAMSLEHATPIKALNTILVRLFRVISKS